MQEGERIYKYCEDLFPLCRSLTGQGVRDTLAYYQNILPGLNVHEVPTGYEAFDWTVPQEWVIREAWVKDSSGRKIIDFEESNLHVVGYSDPVDKKLSLEELQSHLYSLKDQPDAIPYITSYYKDRWGFCISHEERQALVDGEYHAYIDSEKFQGVLNYADIIIPGETDDEILLSSYVCHPSMGNNELSGPSVLTAIVQWLQEKPRRYTYRIVYVPETIGSIVYISKHLKHLKDKLKAAFILTCLGDDGDFSYVNTPYADTISDKIAAYAAHKCSNERAKAYSFLQRGSDERQYCSPLVDLPAVSICRTKYGEYREYHTSLDNLNFISPVGLQGGFDYVKLIIETAEKNKVYKPACFCEPQLGKRGLYPTISTKETASLTRDMMNIIAYSNGVNDLFDISRFVDIELDKIYPIVDRLVENSVLLPVD